MRPRDRIRDPRLYCGNVTSRRVQAATKDLKDRLTARFGARLARTTLFGSWARGEAGPDSDVDVLVLIEDLTPTERGVVYEMGAEVFMDTNVPVAPLAMSTTEWARLVRLERLLPDEIERDGVPL